LLCCLLLAVRFLRAFLSQYREQPAGKAEYRRYYSFLASACLINVFLFLFQWSDQLLVAVFLPAKEMGVYTASKKTAVVLQLLYIALNAIFVPTVSHFHGAGEHGQLHHSFKTAARWILTLSMPIFLTLVIFAPDILALYGETFPDGATAMRLIAMGCFAHVAIGSTEYILMMTGRQRWMAGNAMVAAAMAIGLGIWTVPRYGMTGAAAIHGGMLILANTVALVQVFLLVRVHPFHTRYFKVLGLGGLTAAVVIFLRGRLAGGHPVVIPLLLIAILFILYSSLVLVLGISGDERGMLLGLKGKIAARLAGRENR
jgi:O-antigen/teichoic acid export membrane protein